MTYEEAIKIVKNNIHNDYTWVIVEALEKQIPKKPVAKHYEANGEHPYIKYACCSCRKPVSPVKDDEKSYHNRYCHKCGQALDWGDER